jgi:predicted acetyltransferase
MGIETSELDALRLTVPQARFRDSFIEAMREMQATGEDDELPAPIETIAEDFPGFVERILDFSANPVGTFVPQSPFWITLGDAYVGRLDIRHRLNDQLRSFGGHIGYDIRPSMRRRGYGTRALALGLVEARKLGLERVLVTTSEHNVASRKIIEANGGVLEDMIPTRFRPELTCRYWIDVPSG